MLSVNQGAFVVGTDGGTVYRCVLSHNKQMEADFTKAIADNQKPKLRSPIRSEFASHSGAFDAPSSTIFVPYLGCRKTCWVPYLGYRKTYLYRIWGTIFGVPLGYQVP